MKPRDGPWRRRYRRPEWAFAAVVAVTAVVAFCLTLVWPPVDLQTLDADVPPAKTPFDRPAVGATRTKSFSCDVASVHDGDTLRCRDGTRIRLHAVAARESDGSCSPGHPCPNASAEAATATLRRLAGGKTIRCEATGHSYNRITAICWNLAGEEINCALIRSGVALVWDRFNRAQPICRT